MNKQPPVTTLSDDMHLEVQIPSSDSWFEPFEKLLLFLEIIHRGDSDSDSDTRSQEFCFRHTHDLSELSDVFLHVNVGEGVGNRIDLRTMRFPCGHQARTWVAQLQEYANGVLSRFRDYCNRLPSDTSSFDGVDLFTCPRCRSILTICDECDTVVACSNQVCAGSQDFEQCRDHGYSICYKCLDSAKSPDDFHFVRCPSCNSLYCNDAIPWCSGYIIRPELSAEELVKQSRNGQLGKESVVRSHPRKPGPCEFCIEDDRAEVWQTCNAKSRNGLCPSLIGDGYCPECISENKGRRCVCGAVWICDTCLVDFSVDRGPRRPKLVSCPRCGTDYCLEGCRYCYFCWVCKCTSVCIGCQTSAEGVGGEDMSGKILQPSDTFEKCLHCLAYMCGECCSAGKDGVKQCSGCQGWLCQMCAKQWDWCISCARRSV